MKFRLATFGFVVIAVISARALGQAPQVPAPDSTLTDYVKRKDASYGWTVKTEAKIGKTSYAEIILTSQTWRGIPWKHQLFVITPKSAKPNHKSALLMIAGGGWKKELEDTNHEAKIPSEAKIFAATAENLGMPVAVLLHVPQQPMFDNKYEDAIIAYTFEQYLKTKDKDWPLLLPMVKSAVQGMTATQEFLKSKEGQPNVEKFVVTGASKRGWTTWLSAVADKRVQAIAPMVIDVLNMPRQMEYMEECWGGQSEQIRDYTERGLHELSKSEIGRQLTSIVDPYSYRDKITLPKLLLLGTNDAYWPVDALNVYWDDLAGSKHVLNVPNAGHGLEDLTRVLGAIVNFSKISAAGKTLPAISWNHEQKGENLIVTMRAPKDHAPKKTNLWVASSDDRDFRDAKWKSTKTEANGEGWMGRIDAPESGYKAVFGEFVFDGDPIDYYLSTTIRVYKAK